MRVIVFASRKGGAGKTTLAAHVAVEAHHQQAGPVAILDLDPMGGLSGWFNDRKLDGPQFYQIGQGGLKGTLDVLRQEKAAQLVVIDTPPAASNSIAAIISLADLVVVPVIPSPNDLRAIAETLDMVEQAGRPLEFVVNNASTNGRLTHQAAAELSQHGTVSPVIIKTRQDFRSSMTDGRVAVEINPKSKSAEEIHALWKYIESKLNKQDKRNGNRTSRTA